MEKCLDKKAKTVEKISDENVKTKKITEEEKRKLQLQIDNLPYWGKFICKSTTTESTELNFLFRKNLNKIGRNAKLVDFVLNKNFVSNMHCIIDLKEKVDGSAHKVFLTDMSRNGIFVKNVLVGHRKTVEIEHGEMIYFTKPDALARIVEPTMYRFEILPEAFTQDIIAQRQACRLAIASSDNSRNISLPSSRGIGNKKTSISFTTNSEESVGEKRKIERCSNELDVSPKTIKLEIGRTNGSKRQRALKPESDDEDKLVNETSTLFYANKELRKKLEAALIMESHLKEENRKILKEQNQKDILIKNSQSLIEKHSKKEQDLLQQIDRHKDEIKSIKASVFEEQKTSKQLVDKLSLVKSENQKLSLENEGLKIEHLRSEEKLSAMREENVLLHTHFRAVEKSYHDLNANMMSFGRRLSSFNNWQALNPVETKICSSLDSYNETEIHQDTQGYDECGETEDEGGMSPTQVDADNEIATAPVIVQAKGDMGQYGNSTENSNSKPMPTDKIVNSSVCKEKSHQQSSNRSTGKSTDDSSARDIVAAVTSNISGSNSIKFEKSDCDVINDPEGKNRDKITTTASQKKRWLMLVSENEEDNENSDGNDSSLFSTNTTCDQKRPNEPINGGKSEERDDIADDDDTMMTNITTLSNIEADSPAVYNG